MKTLEIKAPAKINLSLDITGIREDGYHLLSTVMQSISLADMLRITITDGPAAIRLNSDYPGLPLDSRNTCYRAAEYWLAKCGSSFSILIDIEKNIPSEAGLGGGSADAAAVMNGLNSLTGNPLNHNELLDIAARTGADVPFCLNGGTALCEGIGEIITPLPQMPGKPILLVKPDYGLSTPAVFRESDRESRFSVLERDRILAAVESGDWRGLGKISGNVLEIAALKLKPELSVLLDTLRRTEAEMVMMSGSGTCIYAVYESEAVRASSAGSIKQEIPGNTQLIYANTI